MQVDKTGDRSAAALGLVLYCAGLAVVAAALLPRAHGLPRGSSPAAAVAVPAVGSPASNDHWRSTTCGQDDLDNGQRQTVRDPDDDEEVAANLRRLRVQHELTMNDYLSRDYEFLYERVRIGVHEHQYIPNWLPGKKDAHAVRKLRHAKPRLIASYLPKLHSDLQKFAIAIEEMVVDEVFVQRVQDALRVTEAYLRMMICEVETSIASLPHVQLPARVERGIMSEAEREPIDDTRRLVRDWGVLLKYKDYLHAWRHVFNY